MIKGIIITHGDFGKELLNVAEFILEQKSDMKLISFGWNEDLKSVVKEIESFLKENRDNDIVIFTDMFGGSPSNICFKYVGPKVEVLTGVNLPGLLKFLTYKDKDFEFKKFLDIIKRGTIEGVNMVSEYLGEKR